MATATAATATTTTTPATTATHQDNEYTNAFISNCITLMNSIHQGESFTKCLHILYCCAKHLSAARPAISAANWFEPLWFIYYMFYAIHNPKLEEYINRKHTSAIARAKQGGAAAAAATPAIDAAHILKNMIRRRDFTSTIVFQLFDYAFIKKQKATHVYMMPNSKKLQNSETSAQSSHHHHRNEYQLCKSFLSGHLKTTASKIEYLYRCFTSEIHSQTYQSLIQTVIDAATTDATTDAGIHPPTTLYTDNIVEICEKMNKSKYHRKDIIFLSVICYMKVREEDINMKSVFISLTDAETIVTTTEIDACIAAGDIHGPHDHIHDHTTPHPEYTQRYDQLYKYLLS
jgi:hypothetical protein